MDEEPQSQDKQPEENKEPDKDKIIDFNAAKERLKESNKADSHNSTQGDLSDEEKERLLDVRGRIEKQKEGLKFPTVEDLKSDGFTDDQIDQCLAFREIYDQEHRWQNGAEAEKIRKSIFKKLIDGNHILTHSLTGTFAAENVAPREGDGEIEAISEIRNDGKNSLPGVLQLIYRVKAGVDNSINDGSLNTKTINITVREDGNVFMLLNEKNDKDEVVLNRMFSSDNVTVTENRDMDQDEAMDILNHVVHEYNSSADLQKPQREAA